MSVKLKTRQFVSIPERQHTGDTIFHPTVTHFNCAVKHARHIMKSLHTLGHMWLTYKGRYDTSSFAARQSREYVIPGEGQKKSSKQQKM